MKLLLFSQKEMNQQSEATQTTAVRVTDREGSSTCLPTIRKPFWERHPKRKVTKAEIARRKQKRMERKEFREQKRRAKELERERISEQERMQQSRAEEPIQVQVTSWYPPIPISGLPLLQASRSWRGTDFIEHKDPVPIRAENTGINSKVSDPRLANLFYRLGGENFHVGRGQVVKEFLPGEPVDGFVWSLMTTMGLDSCDPVV